MYIPDQELSKYFFVSDLIKFFQAIDINGDGHLEWSEFTEYIIENIRVVDQPKYKNKLFEENEIIFSAYSKISNEYRINKTCDLNCQSAIKKIIYLKQTEQYYVQETYGSSIRIFNSHFNFEDSIDLYGKNLKSAIIDFSLDQESHVTGILFESSLFMCNMKIKTAAKYINEPIKGSLKNCNKI